MRFNYMTKKRIGLLLFLVLTILVVNSYYFIKYNYYVGTTKNNYKEFNLGSNLNNNFGEITSKVKINQFFVGNEDNLNRIDIFVSTFNRKNTGITSIKLIDADTNKVIRDLSIQNSSLKDNSFKTIEFSPVANSKKKVFNLEIKSNVEKGNAVTVWKDNNVSKNTMLLINDKKNDGTIVLKLGYQDRIIIKNVIISNIFFLIVNYFVWKLISFLKNK